MLYPTSLIVWSDIIPRLSWRDVDVAFNKQMDLKRKRINRAGRSCVCANSFGRIVKIDINRNTPGFYKSDGTHLSDVGNQMSLFTFSEALGQFFKDNSVIKYTS